MGRMFGVKPKVALGAEGARAFSARPARKRRSPRRPQPASRPAPAPQPVPPGPTPDPLPIPTPTPVVPVAPPPAARISAGDRPAADAAADRGAGSLFSGDRAAFPARSSRGRRAGGRGCATGWRARLRRLRPGRLRHFHQAQAVGGHAGGSGGRAGARRSRRATSPRASPTPSARAATTSRSRRKRCAPSWPRRSSACWRPWRCRSKSTTGENPSSFWWWGSTAPARPRPSASWRRNFRTRARRCCWRPATRSGPRRSSSCEVWGERQNVPVIAREPGADAAGSPSTPSRRRRSRISTSC